MNEVYRVEIPIDVVDRTEPDMSRIRAKVTAFERQYLATAQRLQRAGTALSGAGRSLTRYLTVPILGAAAATGKLWVDFEHSMSQIRSMVGITGKDFQKMRQYVLDLARTGPIGPKELADALYFVTSSGFEGAQAMNILKISSRAAAAGLGETATVADLITSVLNAYNLSGKEAVWVTDTLIAAVREGKAEPAEMAGAFGRVIGSAEQMGVEFNELASAVAALSLTGLDAAEGVTSINQVLATFMSPTKQTTDALKEMGITVHEVQDSMDKDFLKTLIDLRRELGDDKVAIGQVFGNVRALRGFLNLTGGALGKTRDLFHEVAGAAGDTGAAFDRARKDPMFQFKEAWADLQASLIEAAPTFMEAAMGIVDVLKGIAKWLGEMDPKTLEMLLKVLLAAAVAGPVLRLGGALLGLGGGLVKGMGWLATRGGAGAAATAATGAGGAVAGGLGRAGLGALLRGAGAGLLGFGPQAIIGAGLLGGMGIIGAERAVSARRRQAESDIAKHGFDSRQGMGAREVLQIDPKTLAGYNREIRRLREQESLTIDDERTLIHLLKVRREILEEINDRRRESNRLAIQPVQTQLGLLKSVNGELSRRTDKELTELIVQGKYKEATKLLRKEVDRATDAYVKHNRKQWDVVDGWQTWSDSTFGVRDGLNKVERQLSSLKGKGVDDVVMLIELFGDLETAIKYAADTEARFELGLGGWNQPLPDESGGGGGNKRKHDYPHTARVRGPGRFAFNVGSMVEDVTFVPHGQKGRGAGGGVSVTVADGAVRVTVRGNADRKAVKELAHEVAGEIATEVESLLKDRV